MDGLTLLRAARVLGLRAWSEQGRLVVRGPRAADAVARCLLERKPEVITALAGTGRRNAIASESADVFVERLAMGDEQGMDTAPGGKAWAVAIREARRIAACIPRAVAREPDVIDHLLDAFAPVGLRCVSVEPRSATTEEMREVVP